MRSLTNFLAVPVAAAAIAAAAAMAAPAAHADTFNIDQSGTVTLTVPVSYVAQLLKAGVIEFPVPLSEVSANGADQTVTVTFNVTGGDADSSVFFGEADLGGTFDIANVTGHFVSMGNLQLDVQDAQIVGTPVGTSTPIALLDLTSVTATSTVSPTNSLAFSDTYDADSATVDATGAAFLNNALHTKAFVAGQLVGSVAASWSAVFPA